MVEGRQGATGLIHQVGPQDQRIAEGHVHADPLTHHHVDAEFLAQFTRQCCDFGFSRRHLAARQLPQAGQIWRTLSLRDEQRPVGDQCSGDHDLHGL